MSCNVYEIIVLEVGSNSCQGAGAPTMFEAMRRITDCLQNHSVRENSFARAIRNSFLGKF